MQKFSFSKRIFPAGFPVYRDDLADWGPQLAKAVVEAGVSTDILDGRWRYLRGGPPLTRRYTPLRGVQLDATLEQGVLTLVIRKVRPDVVGPRGAVEVVGSGGEFLTVEGDRLCRRQAVMNYTGAAPEVVDKAIFDAGPVRVRVNVGVGGDVDWDLAEPDAEAGALVGGWGTSATWVGHVATLGDVEDAAARLRGKCRETWQAVNL